MADNEWEDIAVPNQDEWEDVPNRVPADANLKQQSNFDFASQHPYLKTLQDSANELSGDVGTFGKNAVLSSAKLIQGIANKTGFGNQKVEGIINSDIGQKIRNYNPSMPTSYPGMVVRQIAGQAGNFAPVLALGNPLAKAFASAPVVGARGSLGLWGATPYGLTNAAINDVQASGENRPELPAAVSGFGQGVGFGLASAGGSALGRMAQPVLGKFAPNLGSGLASAGFGAASAPDGERVSSAISSGALGAFNPMNPINRVTQEQYNDHLDKAADGYRTVLNPDKNILNSNIDVDNATKTLAQNGVIIKTDVNNKIDNSHGIQQLQNANKPYFDQLQKIVSSDPHKIFDLEEIRQDAKDQMEPYFKNAEELHSAQAQVDNAIDAEIKRHGQFVNGPKLMTIKQGMYERAFNPLQPTANDGARAVGLASKNAIEQAFPTSGIAEINSKIGDNLEAMRLLEKTNGGGVQRGKIGKYAAQLTGALALDKIPIVGPIIGGTVGGGLSDFMNSPERITSGITNRMKGLEVNNPPTPMTKRPGVAKPEIMLPHDPVKPLDFNPLNNALPNRSFSPNGLLGYNPIPEYIKQRMASTEGNPNSGIPTQPGGLPVQMPPNPSALGLPNPGLPIRPIETSSPIGSGNARAMTNQTNPNVESPTFRNVGDRVRSQSASFAKGGLATAAALGFGSMFNPLNANAAQVKEPERLQLPADEYTKKEEGFQAHPYVDTKGNKTIGYGFKMDAVGKYLPKLVQEGKRPLTKQEADTLYTKLYGKALQQARDFAGDSWHSLNGQQQKALADMSYNMGGKINGFKKLRQAIEDGDFHSAAREILNSNYAKEAKNRAMRNAALITM